MAGILFNSIGSVLFNNKGYTLVGVPGSVPTPSIDALTFRFAFSQDTSDPEHIYTPKGSWTKVDNYPGYSNVWDYKGYGGNQHEAFDGCFSDNFDPDVRLIEVGDTTALNNTSDMFYGCTNLKSIVWFETKNVTHMGMMFWNCNQLEAVPYFDTGKCQDMAGMFYHCSLIKSIPLFDVKNLYYINGMLEGCESLETGMYDLYVKARSNGKISSYNNCFTNAGTNNPSGRSERAKISSSWGGDY